MINDNIYSKLTPSAKDELTELTENFRESLLEKAYTIAKDRDTANREISLRDILEAQQPTDSAIEKDKVEFKRKRWTTIISFSGAVYAVAGILIYLFQNKKFSIESDLGLIIAIIGVLFSLIAFLYSQLISKRYFTLQTTNTKSTYSNENDYDIVKRWQIIESLARKIMSEKDKNDSMSNSVSFLIRFLSHKIAKDEEEFLKIRELLQMRNKIIHEQYKMSGGERKEFLKLADDLIERLENAQIKNNQKVNTLRVISAKYGTEKKYFDMTKELNQLINNDRLEFVLNNEIVGDPEHGTLKQLDITYEINGVQHTDKYIEGAKVIIPESFADKSKIAANIT